MGQPPVTIFHEYLDEWEFDGKWLPFVQRLAQLAADAGGPARSALGGCSVWPWPAPRGAREGILVWTDVSWPDRRVIALSLGGVLDERGLRCGTVNPHCPNDVDGADLSWQVHGLGRHTLPGLAGLFADWLTAEAKRPVRDLLSRLDHSPRARGTAAPTRPGAGPCACAGTGA